jgi:GNAT superfamily N-acetyltransferase
VKVYSDLEGFPRQIDQPAYYKKLENVGSLTNDPGTELLVAVSRDAEIAGAVVFFHNMAFYGSGGIAATEKNACGFRLLAVDPAFRGQGIGKLLTNVCVRKAKKAMASQMIIHTTASMKTAWKMYESLGFKRSEDLDFMQEDLPVFGLRLSLQS